MKHDDNTDVSCDVWRLVVVAARTITWMFERFEKGQDQWVVGL